MVSWKNTVCLINKQIHSMKHKLTLVLLSFFLGVQCMVAQQMKVTGVVINEDDGEPVIGASIVVKGTTIGTITDLDGKFELAWIIHSLHKKENALLVYLQEKH